MSLKEQILGKPPALASETVRVPGWGFDVIVREFTAGERDRFEEEHIGAGRRDFRARLVVHLSRDNDGQRIFGSEDVEAVAALPARTLEPIVDAALRVTRFGASDVEALEKN